MTNREALILSLRSTVEGGEDVFDDGYAAAESNIAYWIACPHRAYEKGLPCDGKDYADTLFDCGPCKEAWLDKEVAE